MNREVRCPACGEDFGLETDLEVGDTVSCPNCSADLRIKSLDPIELEEDYLGQDDEEDEESYDIDGPEFKEGEHE